MKLMFCEDCGDIVAPSRKNFTIRWCECKRHAVWWEDAMVGKLVVHDALEGRERTGSMYDGFPGTPRAWVIGLHNAVLNSPFPLDAKHVEQLLHDANGYLFKTRGSLVIRIRPLESNDTRWSFKLPGDKDVPSQKSG